MAMSEMSDIVSSRRGFGSPGRGREAARNAALAKGSYLSSMDQTYAKLDEGARQFDANLAQLGKFHDDEMTLEREKLTESGRQFDEGLDLQEEGLDIERDRVEIERDRFGLEEDRHTLDVWKAGETSRQFDAGLDFAKEKHKTDTALDYAQLTLQEKLGMAEIDLGKRGQSHDEIMDYLSIIIGGGELVNEVLKNDDEG